MAESQLHKQILKGNTSATIFYLKTKGKEQRLCRKTRTHRLWTAQDYLKLRL